MQLNVEELKKQGAFVSNKPIKRTIKWCNIDGEEFQADTYIKQLSYYSAISEAKAFNSGDDLTAQRIVGSICHEDGSPVFQMSDITGIKDGEPTERGALCKSLADALLIAISEVNGLGKRSKISTVEKSSGMSSSLPESADKPSKKQKKE